MQQTFARIMHEVFVINTFFTYTVHVKSVTVECVCKYLHATLTCIRGVQNQLVPVYFNMHCIATAAVLSVRSATDFYFKYKALLLVPQTVLLLLQTDHLFSFDRFQFFVLGRPFLLDMLCFPLWVNYHHLAEKREHPCRYPR